MAEAGGRDWPNMRHLRLLELAGRENSLTQAARLVHISQPAASQAVARLARIFAAPLLERVGNSVTLTAEGQIVARRARRALDYLQDPHLVPRGRARQVGPDLLERYVGITQLRVVTLLALTESLGATAQAIGQTEASVQRSIKDIERLIGQPVLEGTRHNHVLTPIGQTIAMRASRALREIDLAHAELRERQGVFDSRVIVGALPLARTQIVPRAIVRLLNAYPAARVEVLDGSYSFLRQRLRLGACDLIIGALRDDAAEQDLLETPLLTDTVQIVARVGHPLAGRRITGQDLARFPWIVSRRDAPAHRVFETLAEAHGLSDMPQGQVTTGSLVILRGIMLDSDALTLISASQIRYEIDQGLMTPLDFPVEGATRTIGITELRNAMPGLLHRELRAFMANEAHKIAGCADGSLHSASENL
ncbi:MAG: LysR family transcriptional regulator [Roseinatronobacter sp.]